jgi:NADH dehydrogenase
MSLPHVVVIGCGFGGLEAVRVLARAPVEVTLIDRTNHHLFQPLLYQVATAGLSAPAVSAPIRHILRREMRRGRLTVLQAEARAVDVAAREVQLDDGSALPYDHLIVAAGATSSWFGHDDWAAHAPGLKTLADAFDIRARLIGAFERAERCTDEAERAAWLSFVVIGGGPTGVELAGTLVEIARHTLPDEFRRIDSRRARVRLVEGADRVLGAFEPVSSASARAQLERLGVEVLTGARVSAIDAAGVTLQTAQGEQRWPSHTVLWAAGVAAVPIGRQIASACGLQADRGGRVPVQTDLSLQGHPEISVIGDLAATTSRGQPVPGVSPAAKQMGRCAAANVVARVQGRSPRPFIYADYGSLATLGRKAAVVQLPVPGLGLLRLSGYAAWLFWLLWTPAPPRWPSPPARHRLRLAPPARLRLDALMAAGGARAAGARRRPAPVEYLPERWQGRNGSGFTGSMGTLVVTLDEALLFADSRYWVQAEAELAGTGIELVKIPTGRDGAHRLAGRPGARRRTVAVDGQVLALAAAQAAAARWTKAGVRCAPTPTCWTPSGPTARAAAGSRSTSTCAPQAPSRAPPSWPGARGDGAARRHPPLRLHRRRHRLDHQPARQRRRLQPGVPGPPADRPHRGPRCSSAPARSTPRCSARAGADGVRLAPYAAPAPALAALPPGSVLLARPAAHHLGLRQAVPAGVQGGRGDQPQHAGQEPQDRRRSRLRARGHGRGRRGDVRVLRLVRGRTGARRALTELTVDERLSAERARARLRRPELPDHRRLQRQRRDAALPRHARSLRTR